MVVSAEGGSGPAPHHFQALDSWRGIAALIVAIEHLAAQGPVLGHRFFWLGSIWVDFFFVLSGFIIAAAYGDRLAQGYPARRFLWLRLGRIWPVHAVVLLAYLGIELLVWLSGSAAITGRTAFAGTRAPGDFAIQLVLLQAVFPAAIMTWSIPSWSISVEMLLYALAALGWRRLGRGGWLAGLVLACIAGWLLTRPDLVGGYHKLLRGISGFGLGMAARQLWTRLGPWLRRQGAERMGLAELALTLAMIGAILRWGFLPFTLGFDLLFALAVLVFAAERGIISRLLLTRPLAGLGTISYSLYLVHSQVETAVTQAIARGAGLLGLGGSFVSAPGSNRPALTGPYADLAALVAVLAAVAAAALCYRLIEHPCRAWSRRIAPRIG